MLDLLRRVVLVYQTLVLLVVRLRGVLPVRAVGVLAQLEATEVAQHPALVALVPLIALLDLPLLDAVAVAARLP